MPTDVDALLEEAERQPFEGWNFEWLTGRLDSDPLPWDYTAAVLDRATQSQAMLDLGTGGGEWLASLDHRPHLTVATEAWPPNVRVAARTLTPFGVHVVQVDPARDNTGEPLAAKASILPFRAGAFDLVVDRHEAFEVGEVVRLLAPGGWFISQQVDAGNDDEYRELFGVDRTEGGPSWSEWLPDQLIKAGLAVVDHDSAPMVQHINDVGALAWGLKAIPWMVPDFTIDRYRHRLRQIQARIDREGPLSVRQRRFFVRATKPA